MIRLARRRVLTGLAAAPLAGFSLAAVLADPENAGLKQSYAAS